MRRSDGRQEKVNGWIKLYRRSLESAVFQRDKLWRVWCYCLLRANHRPRKHLWNNEEVILKPGQFIFGRHQAAEDLLMKRSTVWDQMQLLRELGNLDIKSDSRFSLVTVCNWKSYQGSENEKRQRVRQQSDTDKNEKKKIDDDDEVVLKNEFFTITKNTLGQLRQAYPLIEKLQPEVARVTDVLKEKTRKGEVITTPMGFLHAHLKKRNEQERQKAPQQMHRREGSRGVGPVPIAEVLHGIQDEGH
jgi:hypothetical protein